MSMYAEEEKMRSTSRMQTAGTEKPLVRVVDTIPGLLHALGEITGRTSDIRSALGIISGQRQGLTARPGRSVNHLVDENDKESGSHLDLIEKIMQGLLLAGQELSELAEVVSYLASGSVQGSTHTDAKLDSRSMVVSR